MAVEIFSSMSNLQQATLNAGRLVTLKEFNEGTGLGGGDILIVPPEDAQSFDFPIANGNFARVIVSGETSVTRFGAADNSGIDDAFVKAGAAATAVTFEGLTNVWLDSPATIEKAERIFVCGADLQFKSEEVQFNADSVEIDLGGGRIYGNLKLAQISADTGFDTKLVQVFDASEFEVGDYVSCSLDNNYLPNSTSRVGYIENGDFNRVTDISGNVMTLTYDFLRSSDNPYTGLLPNAWVGNANFSSFGMRFNGSGDVTIKNGRLERFQAYFISVLNGEGDLRTTVLHLKNLNIQFSFIDIIQFQGRGVIFDNTEVGRQYDLSKQLLACNIPHTGFVKFINGCSIARQNKDVEVLSTPFDGTTNTECGLITTDGTNTFDGAQPVDLPTSDFSPGGQIFWGAGVSITDSLHFYQPNGDTAVNGGINLGSDWFLNYFRSLYGTSFRDMTSFEAGVMNFDGTYSECELVYIEITGGLNVQTRYDKYTYYMNNCYVESRALPNFDGGCHIIDNGSYIKLPAENRTTPQIDGSQTFNFVEKTGGYLDGRYRITGVNTVLRNVQIPYKGTAQPEEVVLFSNTTLPNPKDTHLVLMPPLDDDFEGTGLPLEDWEDTLPIAAWFGGNAQNTSPAPPFVNFTILNFDNEYTYGGEGGYSRPYTVRVVNPRIAFDAPSPTRGKFSARLAAGDMRYDYRGDTIVASVLDSERVTTGPAGIVGNTTVDLTSAPTLTDATIIAIYSPTVNNHYYYRINSIVGNTVTLQTPIIIDYPGTEIAFLIK